MSREQLGIVDQRQRDRKLYGDYAYQAPVAARARSHKITVDCATGKRTIETIGLPEIVIVPRAPVKRRLVRTLRPKGTGDWRLPEDPKAVARADDILSCVCRAYFVEPSDLTSDSRHRRHVWPRFAAMALLRGILKISLPSIGSLLGERDHSSVAHGLARVVYLRETDRLYRHQYRTAVRLLRKRWAVA